MKHCRGKSEKNVVLMRSGSTTNAEASIFISKMPNVRIIPEILIF